MMRGMTYQSCSPQKFLGPGCTNQVGDKRKDQRAAHPRPEPE